MVQKWGKIWLELMREIDILDPVLEASNRNVATKVLYNHIPKYTLLMAPSCLGTFTRVILTA